MDKQKKLHRLIILWITSYILVSVSGIVSMVLNGKNHGSYEYPGVLSGYHFFSFVAVAVYFIPLLLMISKLSKQLQYKRIMFISRFVILFLAIWDAFSLVAILVAYAS